MVHMITEALKHMKGELAHMCEAPTMLARCREVGYQWRPRELDPVTTVHLFLLQSLQGNTACSHLPPLAGLRCTAAAVFRPAPACRSSSGSRWYVRPQRSARTRPTMRGDGEATARSW